MGIPAFYRWLTTRYEKTVVPAVEETPSTVSGVAVPLPTSDPNPNGVEYDNLYLDMNGIIHPCFHAENLPAPSSYEEVFEGVFKYVDKIFSIVRPRKLLYLAIDGVAPRAKMNQQRSRRFRAAKDAADEARKLGLSSRDVLELEGETEEARWTKKLDSNVITPGTEFMDLLSRALRYYIHLKMNNDPGWRGIKVILSDATVPGEGEHKIMSYIRLQRNLPGYDPNTRHCLYGLDADLIMLALATHEVHFTILREDVRKVSQETKRRPRKVERKLGQQKHNQGSLETEKNSDMLDRHISGLDFQLVNIWVLREYLAHDMRTPNSTVETKLERLIDDFVFICLFVGNDFLPHIPSLEISEGAIDLLMAVYKKEFVQMGGYLTNSFEIDLSRLEHFIQAVGSHESAIFRKRHHMQKVSGARNKAFSTHQHVLKLSELPLGGSGILPESPELFKLPQAEARSLGKEQQDANSDIDMVRLGEEGWKERYYAEKFDAQHEDEQEKARRHAVMKYMEGIAWVMRYYYEGVCSWDWFYPYHYAPFASDFCGLGQLEIKFTLGKPFKPFDQLMAVLPAARKLMTDPSSPLLDFYPSDIETDMNGKRFSWQTICKLPFIEESRLLSEIAKVEHTLTEDERRRNNWGLDTLFVHIVHPLAIMIIAFICEHSDVESPGAEVSIEIDPKTSGGLNGYVKVTKGTMRPPDIHSPIGGMEMIAENKVLSVLYQLPHFHPHVPMLLEGVILPDKLVRKQEMPHQHSLWHEIRNHHHVSSRRPMKNAISGPRLARCAHLLVSKVFPPRQQDQRGMFKPSYALGRLGVAEMKRRTSGRLEETKRTNGRSKGGKDHEDAVPNKGFNPGELEGRCVNPDGFTLNGMTAEKKSEISKKKSRKRKRNKDSCSSHSKDEESKYMEQQVVYDQVNAGSVETTEEVRFKLLSKVDNAITENVGKPNGNNNVKTSKSCLIENCNPASNSDVCMLSDQAVEGKMEVKTKKRRNRKKRRVNSNVQGSMGVALEEQKAAQGYDEATLSNQAGKPTTELKTKKKQNRKKRRQAADDSNVQSLESFILEKRTASADNDMCLLSNQASEAKIEVATGEKKSRKERKRGEDGDKIQHLTSCDLNEEKASADCGLYAPSDKAVEAKIDEKPKKKQRKVEENNSAHSGTQNTESSAAGKDRQPAFAHMELKTEGETKKNRRAKRKSGTVNNIAPSDTQTMETCWAGEDRQPVLPQAAPVKVDCITSSIFVEAKAGSDLPTGQNTESSAAGKDRQPAFAHMELKTEGETKKNRRAKRKSGTVNNIAPSDTQTMETCWAGEDRQPVLPQAAPVKVDCITSSIFMEAKAGSDLPTGQNTESSAAGKDRQPVFAHMELKTEGETKKNRRAKRKSGTVNNIAPSDTQTMETCWAGEDSQAVLPQAALVKVDCITSSIFVEAKAGSDLPTGQNTESSAAGKDRQPDFAHMELKTERKTKKNRRAKRKKRNCEQHCTQ